eukprot:SAG11_NODE_2392_length_3410_cov_20.904259_1_plen_267_part_00
MAAAAAAAAGLRRHRAHCASAAVWPAVLVRLNKNKKTLSNALKRSQTLATASSLHQTLHPSISPPRQYETALQHTMCRDEKGRSGASAVCSAAVRAERGWPAAAQNDLVCSIFHTATIHRPVHGTASTQTDQIPPPAHKRNHGCKYGIYLRYGSFAVFLSVPKGCTLAPWCKQNPPCCATPQTEPRHSFRIISLFILPWRLANLHCLPPQHFNARTRHGSAACCEESASRVMRRRGARRLLVACSSLERLSFQNSLELQVFWVRNT